jgi:hypothetical protein
MRSKRLSAAPGTACFIDFAAQNLRLPACFDTLLQMDEVGIILKKGDLQVGRRLTFAAKGGSMRDSNHAQPDKPEFICEEYINGNYIFCTESWCSRYPQF